MIKNKFVMENMKMGRRGGGSLASSSLSSSPRTRRSGSIKYSSAGSNYSEDQFSFDLESKNMKERKKEKKRKKKSKKKEKKKEEFKKDVFNY